MYIYVYIYIICIYIYYTLFLSFARWRPPSYACCFTNPKFATLRSGATARIQWWAIVSKCLQRFPARPPLVMFIGL